MHSCRTTALRLTKNPISSQAVRTASATSALPRVSSTANGVMSTIACVGTLRERSRGTLRLACADPTAPPLIDFNYLDDPRDLDGCKSRPR